MSKSDTETIKAIKAMTQEWIKCDPTIEYNEDHKPEDMYWVCTIDDLHHECEYSRSCIDQVCNNRLNYKLNRKDINLSSQGITLIILRTHCILHYGSLSRSLIATRVNAQLFYFLSGL